MTELDHSILFLLTRALEAANEAGLVGAGTVIACLYEAQQAQRKLDKAAGRTSAAA